MIPLTKRQMSLLSRLAAGAALLFVLYLLFYRPLISELKTARHKYLNLSNELDQAHDTLGKMGAGSVAKSLITEGEISLAIDEVTRAGKRKGINFVSLTPRHTEEIKDPRFKILPIEMETDSTYQALGEFLGALDDLEKSSVTVEQFDIVADGKNPTRLKARIIIHMVFLR